MANPTFVGGDIANATITIGVVGEASGFPKENLNDVNKNTTWKSSSSDTDGYIDIDFGSGVTRACSGVGLANSNVSRVKLKGASNSGFSSGVVTVISDWTTIGEPDGAVVGTWHTTARRYWRIDIEANGEQQEIGAIVLGAGFQHTFNRDYPMAQRWLAMVARRQTAGGIIYTNKLGDPRRVFEISFSDIQETHKTQVLNFIRDCGNFYSPGIILPDIGFAGETDGTGYYVRLQADEYGILDKDYQIYDSDVLRFVEEV